MRMQTRTIATMTIGGAGSRMGVIRAKQTRRRLRHLLGLHHHVECALRWFVFDKAHDRLEATVEKSEPVDPVVGNTRRVITRYKSEHPPRG